MVCHGPNASTLDTPEEEKQKKMRTSVSQALMPDTSELSAMWCSDFRFVQLSTTGHEAGFSVEARGEPLLAGIWQVKQPRAILCFSPTDQTTALQRSLLCVSCVALVGFIFHNIQFYNPVLFPHATCTPFWLSRPFYVSPGEPTKIPKRRVYL